MRLVVVFTLVSTFPNRKVKSGVGKIAEEELDCHGDTSISFCLCTVLYIT